MGNAGIMYGGEKLCEMKLSRAGVMLKRFGPRPLRHNRRTWRSLVAWSMASLRGMREMVNAHERNKMSTTAASAIPALFNAPWLGGNSRCWTPFSGEQFTGSDRPYFSRPAAIQRGLNRAGVWPNLSALQFTLILSGNI